MVLVVRAGQAMAAALVTLALGACAVPNHYLGIPTRGGVTAEERLAIRQAVDAGQLGQGHCMWIDELSNARTSLPCAVLPNSVLATYAWTDNKHALLELGKRAEEGRGIEQDLDKAEKLYGRAASTTTGGTAVATQNGYEPVTWTSAVGLPEARARLEALRARRAAK